MALNKINSKNNSSNKSGVVSGFESLKDAWYTLKKCNNKKYKNTPTAISFKRKGT